MGNNYEENINMTLQLSRWVLLPMGAWPTSSKLSRTARYLNRLANYICYGFMFLLLGPSIAYVFINMESTYLKIKNTGPLSFLIMATIKYYWLLRNEENIRVCLQRVESDWKSIKHVDDQSIVMINASFGKRLIIICTVFMFGSELFYNVTGPIRAVRAMSEIQNVSDLSVNCPPSRALLHNWTSYANEIFYLIQFLSTIFATATTVGACSLAAIFTTHACGQMEIVMLWLQHLIDGREDLCMDLNSRFAVIVRKHVGIISFIERVETILQNISLVEVFGCTANMCFLGYYIIMEWDQVDFATSIAYSVVLLSLTFNIFIFCYVGELVTEQYEKVGTMSYMIDWYRLPGRKNLDLILIIAMSNASFKLTAGNIIKLSISSFGDVVKAAVTYLNMLRTVTS